MWRKSTVWLPRISSAGRHPAENRERPCLSSPAYLYLWCTCSSRLPPPPRGRAVLCTKAVSRLPCLHVAPQTTRSHRKTRPTVEWSASGTQLWVVSENWHWHHQLPCFQHKLPSWVVKKEPSKRSCNAGLLLNSFHKALSLGSSHLDSRSCLCLGGASWVSRVSHKAPCNF